MRLIIAIGTKSDIKNSCENRVDCAARPSHFAVKVVSTAEQLYGNK
jgi:hypothetical protein